MLLYTKAWGLGRVDLSYWAEKTHLFCLGTFEQFIFNWSGYTRLRAGYHMASVLQVERCCVCLCTMVSISVSGDECSFTRCVYIHYMCVKYLQGMLVVCKVKHSKGSKLMLFRPFPCHNPFFNLVIPWICLNHFAWKAALGRPNRECILPNGFHATRL